MVYEDCYERLQDPALKADLGWQYECRDRMRAMNARGPSE